MVEVQLYSLLIKALEGGEGSASRSALSLPRERPLYRKLGGPQGQSGQVWKISPPPGFDPRTVQPVASRYTDYATRPTSLGGTLLYVYTPIGVFNAWNTSIDAYTEKYLLMIISKPARNM